MSQEQSRMPGEMTTGILKAGLLAVERLPEYTFGSMQASNDHGPTLRLAISPYAFASDLMRVLTLSIYEPKADPALEEPDFWHHVPEYVAANERPNDTVMTPSGLRVVAVRPSTIEEPRAMDWPFVPEHTLQQSNKAAELLGSVATQFTTAAITYPRETSAVGIAVKANATGQFSTRDDMLRFEESLAERFELIEDTYAFDSKVNKLATHYTCVSITDRIPFDFFMRHKTTPLT